MDFQAKVLSDLAVWLSIWWCCYAFKWINCKQKYELRTSFNWGTEETEINVQSWSGMNNSLPHLTCLPSSSWRSLTCLSWKAFLYTTVTCSQTKVWLETNIWKEQKSFILFPSLSESISKEIDLNLDMQKWYKLRTVFCSGIDKYKKRDGTKIWNYIK